MIPISGLTTMGAPARSGSHGEIGAVSAQQSSRLASAVQQAALLQGDIATCFEILMGVHAALVGHGPGLPPKGVQANAVNTPQPVTGLIDDLQVYLSGANDHLADLRATAEAIKNLVSR